MHKNVEYNLVSIMGHNYCQERVTEGVKYGLKIICEFRDGSEQKDFGRNPKHQYSGAFLSFHMHVRHRSKMRHVENAC